VNNLGKPMEKRAKKALYTEGSLFSVFLAKLIHFDIKKAKRLCKKGSWLCIVYC
jgi:hypothetical protein